MGLRYAPETYATLDLKRTATSSLLRGTLQNSRMASLDILPRRLSS